MPMPGHSAAALDAWERRQAALAHCPPAGPPPAPRRQVFTVRPFEASMVADEILAKLTGKPGGRLLTPAAAPEPAARAATGAQRACSSLTLVLFFFSGYGRPFWRFESCCAAV